MSDWVPHLVQHIERLRGEASHAGFRLFLAVEEAALKTSTALLQGATVICWEPPQVELRIPNYAVFCISTRESAA